MKPNELHVRKLSFLGLLTCGQCCCQCWMEIFAWGEKGEKLWIAQFEVYTARRAVPARNELAPFSRRNDLGYCLTRNIKNQYILRSGTIMTRQCLPTILSPSHTHSLCLTA